MISPDLQDASPGRGLSGSSKKIVAKIFYPFNIKPLEHENL
jgi:hypothetical protein